MPIEFNCESCARLLRVPDGSGGKSCQCPGCGELLEIPTPGILIEEGDASASDGKLRIPCPKCKHELVCDPKLLGTKGQCRNCKQIFTITESPTNSATVEKSENLVFSCPKCSQLFEGKESMQGRRGKCHACGEVFNIKLRPADENSSTSSIGSEVEPKATSEVPATTAFTKPSSSKQSKPSQTQSPPSIKAPASRPEAKTRATSSRSNSSASRSSSKPANVPQPNSGSKSAPIRFSCTSCAGVMEVPGSTAGQITICPYCNSQLTIPQKSTVASTPQVNRAAQAPAPAPNADIFSDLGVPSAAPSMPAYNPYAPAPNYGPPATSAYSAPRRSSGGNSDVPYIVAGIIIILASVLEILSSIVSIVQYSIIMFDPRVQQRGLIVILIVYIVVAVLMLILSTVKLLGGIALTRRVGLSMARTAAVLSCFPFICCLPIGIWACVLTFSKSAERKFD